MTINNRTYLRLSATNIRSRMKFNRFKRGFLDLLNKKFIIALLFFSVTLVMSVAASAETTETTEPEQTTVTETAPAETTETSAVITAEDERLAGLISEKYSITVTAQEVADLHATGIGYGEISKAYGFASLSGMTASDVLAMRQTAGWGAIAKSMGIKVSDVTRNEKAIENSMNKVKENTRTTAQNGQNANSGSSKNGGNSGGNGNGNGNGNGGGNNGGHNK